MNFLNYIDNAYQESRKSQSVQEQNNDYRIYLNLIPVDYKSYVTFICMKNDKTYVVVSVDNILTYLSDSDIIYTIIQDSIVPEDILITFIDLFKDLYRGKFNKFNFDLNGTKYSGFGIPYFADNNLKLTLHSDIEISLNDFVFVLNMVFEKDRLTDTEFGGDHLKHTLCKYISLSQHYGLGLPLAKVFLDSIGYQAKLPIKDSLEKNELGQRRKVFKECELSIFEKSGLL